LNKIEYSKYEISHGNLHPIRHESTQETLMEAEANMVQTFQKTPRAFPRRAPYSDGKRSAPVGALGLFASDYDIILQGKFPCFDCGCCTRIFLKLCTCNVVFNGNCAFPVLLAVIVHIGSISTLCIYYFKNIFTICSVCVK